MADNATIAGVLIATQHRLGAGPHFQKFSESALNCVSTPTAYNVTTTSAATLSANADREGVDIYNFSDTVIWCAWGSTPVKTPGAELGFPIPAFGPPEKIRGLVDTRVLNAVHNGSGNKRLVVMEYVKVVA